MYSYVDRIRAFELYINVGNRVSPTLRRLDKTKASELVFECFEKPDNLIQHPLTLAPNLPVDVQAKRPGQAGQRDHHHRRRNRRDDERHCRCRGNHATHLTKPQ